MYLANSLPIPPVVPVINASGWLVIVFNLLLDPRKPVNAEYDCVGGEEISFVMVDVCILGMILYLYTVSCDIVHEEYTQLILHIVLIVLIVLGLHIVQFRTAVEAVPNTI